MAQKILLKRSNTTGNYPTSSQIEIGELAINTYDGSMFMKLNDGSSSVIALHHNQALHYDTSNDRVGIGTTSPGRQLHVQMPNLAAGTGNGIRITDDSALMEIGLRKDGSGNRRLAIFEDGGTYPLVLQEDGGNVGIGTTSPSYNLDVNPGSASAFVRFKGTHSSLMLDRSSTSYDSNLMFQTNGTTKWRLWNDGSDDTLQIRDEANAANVMTWKTGGSVGIGTEPSSATNLHVQNSNGTTVLEGVFPACQPDPCFDNFPVGTGVLDNCSGIVLHEECIAWCEAGYCRER